MAEQVYREEEEKGEFWEECFSWCGQWGRSDKLDTIGWAFIFFWGALIVLAESSGYAASVSWWWDGWGVFIAGVGVIVLVETAFRLIMPRYRRGIGFGLILGAVLVGIGTGGWGLILPLALAAIGIVILSKALSGKG